VVLALTRQDIGSQVSKLVARAWLDEDFKSQFTANPRQILEEAGIDVAEGVEVRIDESAQRWSIQVSKLVARAWLDENFKSQLTANPQQILEEAGIDVAEGVEVRIDESAQHWSIQPSEDMSGAVWTIPLPPRPASVADEQLTEWADERVSRSASLIAPECC
jgi:hypothetical protein